MPLAKTRGKDVQSKNAFMVTIFATSIFFSQVSYSRCYNLDLKNAGFEIHPQINFDELDATLDKKMIDEQDDAQGHGNYAYMGMGSLQPWGNPDIYQYLVIDDVRIGRNADELLRKVQAAQFIATHPYEVCPAKWRPGEKTLKPGLDLVGKI